MAHCARKILNNTKHYKNFKLIKKVKIMSTSNSKIVECILSTKETHGHWESMTNGQLWVIHIGECSPLSRTNIWLSSDTMASLCTEALIDYQACLAGVVPNSLT